MIQINPETTAFVVIDLQKGIMGRPLAPHSGEQVISLTKELAERFRIAGSTVVLVNVAFSKDFKDALRPQVDEPMQLPPGGFPENFSELVDGLAQPGDLFITKRNWGAFYGTELDLQLRRRGIKTIVLGGVATNMGVESTARAAHEHGYSLVLVEDISSTFSLEMHEFSFKKIFPRISRVATVSELELVK